MKKLLASIALLLILFYISASMIVHSQNISGANASGVLNFLAGSLTIGGLQPVLSSSSLTSNAIVLGAGGQSSQTNPAFTTNGTTTMTVGVVGGGNGVLALAGNTSGTSTFTAAAIAGTSTNPVTASNIALWPVGAVGTPAFAYSGDTATGLWHSGAGAQDFAVSGTDRFQISTSEIKGQNTLPFCWGSGVPTAGGCDTSMSRSAQAIIAFGSGAAGNTTARIKASGYMSVGTKFTTNNGCTDSATAGGATAGTFTVGSTSCTEIITMGDSATAPNGWSCTVVDITTLADVTNPHQTTSNATTATIVTGTVVSGDKIQFSCIGY